MELGMGGEGKLIDLKIETPEQMVGLADNFI